MLTTRQALAAGAPGFDARTLDAALKALGGTATDSREIVITSPDIAENGAAVPVAVISKLPNTQEIYILVEKNPNPAHGRFHDRRRHRALCLDAHEDGPRYECVRGRQG